MHAGDRIIAHRNMPVATMVERGGAWPVPNERSWESCLAVFDFSRSLSREPMALPIWSICSLSVNGNLKLGFLVSIVDFGLWSLSNLAHVMCSLLSALCVILLVASPSHWVRAKSVECRNSPEHATVIGQIILMGTSAVCELMLAGELFLWSSLRCAVPTLH